MPHCPIFTGTVTCGAVTAPGVITFPGTMPLGTDLSSARVVHWPGPGNEWYGFGMNAHTLTTDLNMVTKTLTYFHKLYNSQ